MEENQNGLRLDITTLDYVLGDLTQFIENELKDVAENTAEDITRFPLYEISQSEIRIQIYESVKESLTDFMEMYEAKIEEILIDMAEQEELNNRNSEFCELSGFNCDDCYISECSSSACCSQSGINNV